MCVGLISFNNHVIDGNDSSTTAVGFLSTYPGSFRTLRSMVNPIPITSDAEYLATINRSFEICS